jgi:DeoR/GlpR family transcriptional regulator of sugar metabolism
MLARHRQSLILQAVRNDGSARVSDLTQQLGVSDMTIRRDLEVLAKDGLVEKVHGGAVLPGSHGGHEPGFEDKLVLERPEKTARRQAWSGPAPRSRSRPGQPRSPSPSACSTCRG